MTLPGPDEWPTREPLPDESADLLRERATATPEATALVDADEGTTWTYEAFDRLVDDLAGGLSAHLKMDGRRIGLLLPTGPSFATAYFALVRSNGIAVPLNRRESADTVAKQSERADLVAVLCAEETESMARAVAPPDATVLTVDEPVTGDVAEIEPTTDDGLVRTADGETERLILFTSGTTGEPKGVRLTRGNLVASAVGSADRLGVERNDRWLVCLPMYHMGGLAPLVRSTLYGTTTVIQQSFEASETAQTLDEASITGVSLVPTMLTRLLDDGWRPPETLRFVLLGGAPARPDLIERCEEAGVPVFPTYGTTETASQITTATPAEAFARPETVGRPIEGTDVTVRDGGTSCAPGDVGELVVSGPTVTPGYLDERQTAEAFEDDGFHTGDLGYRDGDGRYFVVGRVDDQIVTGGENVQPAVVKQALEDLQTVAEAAVVGLPDGEWGQRVAAAVVPATETTPQDVIDAVSDSLADFAVPKTVALLEELPKTQSGTVDRERVREQIRAADS